VTNAPRILIIDDDERLSEMLTSYLRSRGFSVEHRIDGTSGVAAALHGQHDAIVLDIMLPDFDGLEVLRRIRAESVIPVIMLTARGEEMDRIVGLELGADDYLPKPFNPRELIARITAVLRRGRPTQASAAGDILRFGKLEIDRAAREARVAGRPCLLTSHQFSLLLALAERAGRVQTREQLMQAVRGEDLEDFDRSIDVHISRIRAAIEADPKKPRRIKTVRGAGYIFTDAGEDESS
jgi:DNA-binding response OmpR family regulator